MSDHNHTVTWPGQAFEILQQSMVQAAWVLFCKVSLVSEVLASQTWAHIWTTSTQIKTHTVEQFC